MIVLTAYAHVTREALAAALDACSTVRSHSVKEKGCERYDFYQSPADPTRIVFVEEWTSKADLDVHFEQEAFKTFIGTMTPLFVSPPEIRIFESTLVS
ncbi:MAG TPA: putative quinol monooxygenase [Fimbriimonas sp.]|nr:putative quinol monooxygenase [Fimbriimonas sp.]